MNNPKKAINTAVILAAGMGSRLGDLNNNKPKGLLKIGTKPIIQESIEKLSKAGIKKIYVVIGYKYKIYVDFFKENFPNVILIRNADYKSTNTLFSLSKIKNLINEDFLLLESDLVYESKAILEIIKNKEENLIILSGKTFNGDEVFVKSKNGNLINMSKDLSKLEGSYTGEFVGISKISLDFFKEIMNFFNKSSDRKKLSYEEDAFVECAKKIKIKCLHLKKLLWSEIDDEYHLNKARKIYKKLT
ncbi:MAG: sugar nucleotidyltransferase [Gammaproteobacteria bacterium]|nr:sugar nucleotidyltransferase [Gammaproteobacteria bacterium]|tara:strand:- start:3955 stop:4692 length:738 start_codon:yes stop_codon:yes gene_type:complete